MMTWKQRSETLLDHTLLFLILRFAVFLLIAASITANLEGDPDLRHWLALGYFAVSEILLLVRSSRWFQQGVSIGIYFLDVYAVSSLIMAQELSLFWYLAIPALMLGVSLSYVRKASWFSIALIPSVLILQQLLSLPALSPEKLWEFGGVAFLFFVFSGTVYRVVNRLDRFRILYNGQRQLVQGVSTMHPPASLGDCMRKVLQKGPPLAVDYTALLFWDREGNLGGLERREGGETGEVRVGAQRLPDLLKNVKQSDAYFPEIPACDEAECFFQTRRVVSLLVCPLRVDDLEGWVLFGRTGRHGFTLNDQEILRLHAELVRGWLRRSHEKEREAALGREACGVPEAQTAAAAPVCGESQESGERLRFLEQENQQLREALDDEVRQATYELKKSTLVVLAKEMEVNQQVLERLATADLSQAVSMLFDLDLILDLILDVICNKLAVQTASIMLLRDATGDLVIRAHRGLEEEIVWKTRLMVGEAIAGYVAQKGEPLLIEDIRKDPRFVPFRRDRYRSGSLLSVPILHNGHVLGVINLSDPGQHGPFTERDLEVLQALAGQAAIAIEHDRLYQEFRNGQWIRELYEESLTQKLSEKVFHGGHVLERVEGEYKVTILSVRLHEEPSLRVLSSELDRVDRIERLYEQIRELLVSCNGDVAGDVGAGMIGIFGVPFPDPEDAWRAVIAAVELLKSFARPDPNGDRQGVGLSVGIATGDVLLRRKSGAVPYAVFGDTWEQAITLMHAGSPGQILVDESTFERVRPHAHGLRFILPYGINKQMTAYGIKGLKKRADARRPLADKAGA